MLWERCDQKDLNKNKEISKKKSENYFLWKFKKIRLEDIFKWCVLDV